MKRWFAVFVLCALAGGCVRGIVNASPNLRWWLFSNFGASKMCPEMLKRGAPLRLTPNGNTIGRFFPNRCRQEIQEGQRTITIHFGGTGYAWTPVAGRIGFSADAAVEYRPDFQMTKDAIYVWAKTNRIPYGPEFAIGSVENKLVDWATRTPVGYLANTFGSQVASSQMTSGFTVVRTDQGDDFSLGILMPPQRPAHPFDIEDDERFVFANETTEVRSGQVDFLGPFEVTEQNQALFFRFRVAGPPVDALVFYRAAADAWRDALQRGAPLGTPPQPPFNSFAVQPGAEARQTIRLPPGQYYLVLDNSAVVGSVAPPWNPLAVVGGNAAVVSYTAELGEVD